MNISYSIDPYCPGSNGKRQSFPAFRCHSLNSFNNIKKRPPIHIPNNCPASNILQAALISFEVVLIVRQFVLMRKTREKCILFVHTRQHGVKIFGPNNSPMVNSFFCLSSGYFGRLEHNIHVPSQFPNIK